MELRLNIDYENLLQLIKQLPGDQLKKLKEDLSRVNPENSIDTKGSLSDFLLSGPTMSEEEYSRFLENRKSFNKWLTK